MMVTCFEAVLYAQFHSRPLNLNIVAVWDKRYQSLGWPMHLICKGRLFLLLWISKPDLENPFPQKIFKFLMTDTRLWGYGEILDALSVQNLVVEGSTSSYQHPTMKFGFPFHTAPLCCRVTQQEGLEGWSLHLKVLQAL